MVFFQMLDHEIRLIWFSTRLKSKTWFFTFLNMFISRIEWDKILISQLSRPKYLFYRFLCFSVLFLFFLFELSFTVSECLKLLNFFCRALILTKIFYVLVQLWGEKVFVTSTTSVRKKDATTVLPDSHFLYLYDTSSTS